MIRRFIPLRFWPRLVRRATRPPATTVIKVNGRSIIITRRAA